MSPRQRYAKRLDIAANIIETQTHLMKYLLRYAEEHGIPLPTSSDKFISLEAQADRAIHEMILESDATNQNGQNLGECR